MTDFDEYEYEGKRVKVPKGTEPTESLLDSLYQEQKREVHLQKRQEAQEASELSFPRASRAMEAVLKPIAWAGEKFDRIGGAPTRAAIGALQDGEGVSGAAQAFASQFGAPSAEAPTGRDIAVKAGVSERSTADRFPGLAQFLEPTEDDDKIPVPLPGVKNLGELKKMMRGMAGVSPAGAVGLGVDVLADPTNVVPVGAAAKGMARAGGAGMSMAGKATGKAIDLGAKGAAMAADVATGTKAGTKTLGAAKSAIKGTEEAFDALGKAMKSRFGAKLAPDAPKFISVAQKNGIDPELLPESVMFGPTSSASRMARVKAEGPLGKELLDRHEAATQAVQSAIRKDIRAIGGEVVENGKVVKEAKIPPNAYAAGELVKKSYDEGVERAFSEIGETHNSIIGKVPGMAVDQGEWSKLQGKLGELKTYATKRAATGISKTQKEQGQQLLNAIENIDENSKTYAGMVDALRDVGDIAFKSKNVLADIPPDIARFRKLYGDLNEALVGTVKINEPIIGQNAAQSLIESNKKISSMYGDKSLLSMLGDEGKSPERLFKGLVVDGDAQRIQALKKYLSPEQMQQVKAAAIQSLIKETPQSEFTFRSLHNAMRGKKEVFGALFDPAELENISDLIQLGDKMGPAVMSTSGTGASLGFGNILSKPLELAERGVDAAAASKQKAAASRAIGFQAENTTKAAAKKGGRPPTMGLADIGASSPLTVKNPRGKAAQVYHLQTQKDEDRAKEEKE